jgi:hypothetical protein
MRHRRSCAIPPNRGSRSVKGKLSCMAPITAIMCTNDGIPSTLSRELLVVGVPPLGFGHAGSAVQRTVTTIPDMCCGSCCTLGRLLASITAFPNVLSGTG